MLIDQELTPQLRLMRQRVQTLYLQGGALSQQNELLAAAFEELELAFEQLQAAEAEQRREREEWLNERAALDVETQSFKYLFENAPAGYLVTSLDGTIRKVNPIAATLLDCSERNLIGRSIALFVPEGQRREFRAQIGQLSAIEGVQEKTLTMQSWEHTSFKAGLTVAAVRGKTSSRPVALHWLIRAIASQEQALPVLQERAVGMGLDASATPAGARMAGDPPKDGDNDSLARKRFTFLAKASVQLMLAQDLDATFGHVAHLAVPELADACIIDIADPHNQKIQRLVVMHEPKTQQLVRTWRRIFTPEKRAHTSRSAAPWQPPIAARLSDSVDVSRREQLESTLGRLEPASAIVAPLQYGDRQVGSITLIGSKTSRQYDSVDVALIEELACQMSHAAARLHG